MVKGDGKLAHDNASDDEDAEQKYGGDLVTEFHSDGDSLLYCGEDIDKFIGKNCCWKHSERTFKASSDGFQLRDMKACSYIMNKIFLHDSQQLIHSFFACVRAMIFLITIVSYD